MASEKTKKPTGLKITRKGNSFTLSWKIADKDYADGQAMQYRLNGNAWHSVSIGAKTTKKSIPDVSSANWFPPDSKPKLNKVEIRVRGNRKTYTTGSGKNAKTHRPVVSDWSTATYSLKVPNAPTLKVNKSSTYAEVCNFDYKVKTNNSAKRWFDSIVWESILVKDCNTNNGAKLKWKSSTLGWATGTSTDAEGTIRREESTSVIANGSYTRWVRIRARGVKGYSPKNGKWVYKKYVYAMPYQAVIDQDSIKVTERKTGGYFVSLKWQTKKNESHPIASQKVQYLLIQPDADLECPVTDQWQDAENGTFKGASKNGDAAYIIVPTGLADNQCLYLRVVTSYGGNSRDGIPKLAKVGNISTPTGLSITFDDSTNSAQATATNTSEIEDSFIAIQVILPNNNTYYAGIIENGETQSNVMVLPDFASVGGKDKIVFKAIACVGSYEETTGEDDITKFAVEILMQSDEQAMGGEIVQAPKIISALPTSIPGTIHVEWDGGYTDANSTEISWSDHPDAWESTDEPSNYTVPGIHASQWNISGLETGIVWYVRVRSIFGNGDNKTATPWSNIAEVDLASAPAVPVLVLSEGVVTETGKFTASWVYSTTDGTPQAGAVLAEVTGTEAPYDYENLVELNTEQHFTFDVADDLGWQAGENHRLAVKVVSASGKECGDWSVPVSINVAAPLTCEITESDLVAESITVDEVTRTTASLNSLPLTVQVTGAGEGGTTSLAILRAQDYPIIRPDENDYIGFENETVYLHTQTGEDPITISADDPELYGRLDDGAEYRIVATVQDGLGQSAQAESFTLADDSSSEDLDSEPDCFEVHWQHQAAMPSASVIIDNENNIARLTPIAPENTEDWQLDPDDRCDIYRLSADKPVLVYPDAVFGTEYVDPYPALGEFGGHRFVFKSKDGDYIGEVDGAESITMFDTHEDEGDLLETDYNIIEWATGQVMLQLNIDVSNSWAKDFEETKYLGGSVVGDWNKAVSRSGSVKGTAIVSNDESTIEAMRRLGAYAGICHVRTKDGSSIAANVDVSEDYTNDKAHKTAEYNLTITAVDPEGYDGLTYAEWQETQQEDEE